MLEYLKCSRLNYSHKIRKDISRELNHSISNKIEIRIFTFLIISNYNKNSVIRVKYEKYRRKKDIISLCFININ